MSYTESDQSGSVMVSEETPKILDGDKGVFRVPEGCCAHLPGPPAQPYRLHVLKLTDDQAEWLWLVLGSLRVEGMSQIRATAAIAEQLAPVVELIESEKAAEGKAPTE